MAASEREIGKAYRSGYRGARLPSALEGDSFAVSAYQQGVEDRDAGRPPDERLNELGDTSPSPSSGKPSGSSTRRPPNKSASARPANPHRARRKKLEAGLSGRLRVGARARDLIAHPATLGGDGGGLLLAIFAYPIVLAILQYGPDGAGAWFKAKFLNQGPPVIAHTLPGKPA